MPRLASVWYDQKDRCWLTSVGGEVSEKSGRKKPRRNREIGPPEGPDRIRNERMAHEWLEALQEAERRQERAASEPLLKELVAIYLAAQEKRLAARTMQGYRERLESFCLFKGGKDLYGNRLVRDLKPGDLSRFIRAKQADGCGPVYINSIILSINACMNWAARPIDDRIPERILKENPFAGVERPKNPAPEKRYAGQVAHQAFFEYAVMRACLRHDLGSLGWRFDRLTIALFRFVQATGCRPSEACRLRWSMIDWKASTAIMTGKSTHATGKKRVIPIPAATLRMLRCIDHFPNRHPECVFTHGQRDGARPPKDGRWSGIPWVVNALDQKFRKWRDEAIAVGQPIANSGPTKLTLYALRRDLGADILRLRGSHADSAEVLGHSPEMNAKHYASFAHDHALSLTEQIAKARTQR